MPITEQQRQERQQGIGSSDAAAMAGVDPYRSIADVYMEKVYGVAPLEANDAMEMGNDFEVPLLNWAARELGYEIALNVNTIDEQDGVCRSNHDALVVGKQIGMEAKVTGLPDEWGEEGTDQVPDQVIMQTHHQMLSGKLVEVVVPVLLARYGRPKRCLYVVRRDEELITTIRQLSNTLWHKHIVPKIPPPDVIASIGVLKRLNRVPEQMARVDPALVRRFERAKRLEKKVKEAVEARYEALIYALGDSEAADYGDPNYLYTYRETPRVDLDPAAVRAKAPEVWERFKRESTYRQLRRVARNPKRKRR